MAGLVVADGIQTPSLSDGAKISSASDIVNGSARAWVNFDGTGTVAIRASYNVSSITDNGTGDYTVNFTSAMPDVNYSTNASCIGQSTSANYLIVASTNASLLKTQFAFRFNTINMSSTKVDIDQIHASIHR